MNTIDRRSLIVAALVWAVAVAAFTVHVAKDRPSVTHIAR